MGNGVSKDGASALTPNDKPKKNSNWTSKAQPPKTGNTGSPDIFHVGLTKLGFSPSEITIREGQTLSIKWNVASGNNGHNVRQVVFDGQTAYPVQGGYNSGPQSGDGKFDINFNMQGEFKFISDGYETNTGKVLHVNVKSRHYIVAEVTDEEFNPSVLHVQQGSGVKWTWNSLSEPCAIREVTLCPKHCGILKTTGGMSTPMQSGSYKHEFATPGMFYFQTTKDDDTKLCIVHVKAVQQSHYIEVTDRKFSPRLLSVTQGDRVWWLWDRFKCKKKHRIQQMEVPTGHSITDPFPQPVKGGFSSPIPSRAGMLSHVFTEPGVYYYCDNNYEDNREYLGVVTVKPRAKEHHIEVTADGFYPDLSVVNSGDSIWWKWEVNEVQDNFSVLQVDSCVASDSKIVNQTDCNNLCTFLTEKAAVMVTGVGISSVRLNTPGVYHFRVSDTPITVGSYSVIVNPGQKDHFITVSDTGFDPKVVRVHPGDRVWWLWENTKQQHNIIQVSHHGHPIVDGFCSGEPQDSPAAFVSQFDAGAVVYYQSVALPKLYGAVVAVSQAQVHQVLVAKNHLQPDPVLAQTGDCVAWVWPVLRKHGLTQVTKTQQVYELQTYTQDVVTPRRCCALRFSNPGVYHYYSKAFSNKTDKFMYEHSSKTVLSSVVVSNPTGPITVLVSGKGFKPPSVNIQRGQGVLWSWKGSQSETHNIVHANPPTHERPYSTVTGPLAFSSGNPEPNNSFLYTFEEPGTFYQTSEGAPGCVAVVHVLDSESLSPMPFIVSGSNGGVVEYNHNARLECSSQTATILYTLDGSIPELHANATRVYKPEKGVNLRQSGLHIIRAITIGSGALPSQVFTSKRFWVLEGNTGHSSEEEDAFSMATDDYEMQSNAGPGPTNKWKWWNCAPSISGWLHSSSDSSIEMYWDIPSAPYIDQLKSYQLNVNGMCYHKDLPPTCNSITVEGFTGNKTYTVSIIAQPNDISMPQQESNSLRVTCPAIYELGGPILSCELTDQEDTIDLVWTSLDSLFDGGITYEIYMDGKQQNGEIKTVGDYKTCRMTLPETNADQVSIPIFIVAQPSGKSEDSDRYLSNVMTLKIPLCLDNMQVPISGGNLVGKPFLVIGEGSGKPPDSGTELLPSVQERDSFDGSISTVTHGDAVTKDTRLAASPRSLECEESYHQSANDVQDNSEEDERKVARIDHSQSDSSSSDSVSNACPVTNPESTGTQHEALINHPADNINIGGPKTKGTGETDLTTCQSSAEIPQGQMAPTAQQTPQTENISDKDSLDLDTDEQALPSPQAGDANREPDCEEADPPLVESQSSPQPIESPPQREASSSPDEAVSDEETGAVLIQIPRNASSVDQGISPNPHPQQLSSDDTQPAPAENQNRDDPSCDSSDMHASRVEESDNRSVLHDGSSLSEVCPVSSILSVHGDISQKHDAVVGNTEPDESMKPPISEKTVPHQDEALDHRVSHGTTNQHDGDDVAMISHGDDASSCEHHHIGDDSDVNNHLRKTASKQDEELTLPKPVVSVGSKPSEAELHIRWQIAYSQHSPYVLHHYNVCVAGRQFANSVSSQSSQEVSTESGETEIQHVWNAGRGQVFIPAGLTENTTYKVTVQATYHHRATPHRSHVKASSSPVICTTGGQPQPPKLQVKSVGLQEVTLTWEPGLCHEDIDVMGYQLVRNGKPMSEIVPYGKTKKTIKNLQPDAKHYFTLSLVTTNAGQSKASNLITVQCPEVPDAPTIKQEPATLANSAIITWHRQKNKQLSSYRLFVDGKLHGELKAKTSKKHTHHKYALHNLEANGHQHRVTVKACAGWTSLNKKDHNVDVNCGVLSGDSNPLMVTCSSPPPASLDLKLECLHCDGLDITWSVKDQDQAADIEGFIIMKNGHPYSSSPLPATISHATLSDLQLGSVLAVQVLAITQSLTPNDSSDEPATPEELEDALQKLAPNSILLSNVVQVAYDNLVQVPCRVWCELITSHSVMLVWDKGKKPKKHFVAADSYTVTWWELSKKSGEPPQTKVTSDDHLLISGLDLGTKYCITVQAQARHAQPHDTEDNATHPDPATYYVPTLSQTESVTVTTASPPEPPHNLAVASVGTNTIQLKWDPPTEKGSEIIGLRMYVTTVSGSSLKTVQHVDLLPDATSTIIKHLKESATYTAHLVTITDEFFDQDTAADSSPSTRIRSLPEVWNLVPKDSPWLPCVSIDTTTAGMSPPSSLSCNFDRDDAVVLNWRAPGNDQRTIRKYEVQYWEVKNGATSSASDPHQVIEVSNLEQETVSCEILGLIRGKTYSMTVIAVIAESDSGKHRSKKRKGKKRNHQCRETLTRLASEPYVVRIPAPCIAPSVVVTGFGPSWVDVYWEKPLLVTILKNTDDANICKCLRRSLLGYKLQVNGAVYASLKPSTQRYTVQCSPGKSYDINLVAITTTDKTMFKKLSSGRNHSRSDSSELEGLCDQAVSDTVTVTLPKHQSGNIVEVSAKFKSSASGRQSDDTEENDDVQGDIDLRWTLQDCGTAEEQGIMGYDITWVNDLDGEERVATVTHTANSYDIPVYHNRCTYKMSIRASQHDDMWQDDTMPSISCIIPGSPDPPPLCCTSIMQEEFILEWGEPRLYGGAAVQGYQVYMNDKKVGQELNATHFKAAIPCRPNRTYRMSIVAISADPNYRDSDLSEEVLVTCWSPENQSTGHLTSALRRERSVGQGDSLMRGGSLCPEDIAIGVTDLTETSIALEWRLPLLGFESQELVDRIKVSWSSVAKPKELEALLKPTATQYTIRACMPGTNHFVTIMALDESDRVLHRSQQVTIQTTAPLTAPHLRIRSCTYSGCILEWDKPTQFGNAHLTGYQLCLNGKDHDKLPAGATTYLFTAGKMCREYRFTLQALCNIEHLHSQLSDTHETTVVTWPGAVPPALQRSATTKLNTIKVSWPEPKVTGGAKVQHYQVMCIEESGTGNKALLSNRRQPPKTCGPLPPEQRWAEFPHLSPHAAYTILLDTHVSGVAKAMRSKPMNKHYVARRPVAPSVRVRVRGLEERLALETEACQLINTRHRLLQELISYQQASNQGFPPGEMENEDHASEITDALSALAEMEDQLFQVLETLLPYTGTVSVDVEWDPIPGNKDVNLSGFKVLVNGKQHGFLLHSHIDHICLQLSAYDGLHKIGVVAATDHPVGNSESSEVTVVDTSPFLPFTCYCLHSVHHKHSRHPQEGSCCYQQTLAQEVSPGSSSSLMGLHQQLDPTSRRIPPASVTVIDVLDRAPHLLVPTKLTNRCPTVLLFWTPWCLASQKTMDQFVNFARSRAGKLICLTCCCNSGESGSQTHLQTLARQIVARGWRHDNLIRHSCSCSTSDTGLMPGSRVGSASTERGSSCTERPQTGSTAVSVAELFGVVATPTFIILHPEGYLAWQGCFAANDDRSFTSTMDETIESVAKTSRLSSPRSDPSPKLLSRSTSASSFTVSSLHHAYPGGSHQATDPQRIRNTSASTTSLTSTSSSQLNGSTAIRAKTARKRRPLRQKMISLEHRPFSGDEQRGPGKTKGRPQSSDTV